MSIVLYLGPSMLDGAPIVVLASVDSSNRKTGSLVQTWIMRADRSPVEASKRGHDASVCGSCSRRHSLGGDCYVQIWQGPGGVWRAWDVAGKPGENWTDPAHIVAMGNDRGLRLGSYGDPMAVPAHVWQDLIEAIQPSKVVGYTHQWRTVGHQEIAWFRTSVMASCDSTEEASLARYLGWRYFLAIPAGVVAPDRTIECPATTSAARTCDTCGACNGAGTGYSVFLREHGARSQGKAKRSALLQVIQ